MLSEQVAAEESEVQAKVTGIALDVVLNTFTPVLPVPPAAGKVAVVLYIRMARGPKMSHVPVEVEAA